MGWCTHQHANAVGVRLKSPFFSNFAPSGTPLFMHPYNHDTQGSEGNTMRYWYGYTGESLILGHGRAIRQVVPHSQALRQLLIRADEYYARYAATSNRRGQTADAKTFTAALLAPLALQELSVSSPPATIFSSARQVLRLFEDINIEQAAINLFNGRIASAYAEAGDADSIVARVAQSFDDGDLLILSRDAALLHAKEILNTLPGAMVFLLSRSQAERKAFAGYLRRGTPPVVHADAIAAIGAARPILRTWEHEVRLETQYAGANV